MSFYENVGRPKATYADFYVSQARENPGQWHLYRVSDPQMLNKIVRWIRREVEECDAHAWVQPTPDGADPMLALRIHPKEYPVEPHCA